MEKVLKKFEELCHDPYKRIAEAKKSINKKIIGCFPMYFPDEIVHAAGLLPITLFATDEAITMADKHLMPNACDQVRSTYDSLLKGKYDFLDGVAAIHLCDQVRFFMEVWQLDHPLPFFHQMCRPYNIDRSSRPLLVSELKRLKSSLEAYTGIKITPEAMRKSIELYNTSRTLMRELNQMRRTQPGIVSAANMVNIVASSMLMPREVHTELLKELLVKIETVKKRDDKRIKIVVAGHPCSIPDQALLELIEDPGMVVVDDDLFAGGRSFATDVKPEGDAMEAFADYYMNLIPCTTYHYPERWTGHTSNYSAYADYICNIMKNSDARGLILLKVKYCDPFDMEFVLLKEVLEKRNVPYLVLQTEVGKGPLEAIRTRVDAFREMLESMKGAAIE